MTERERFGCRLNIPRLRMAQAVAMLRALNAARSDAPLGREWADAAAEDPDQAAQVLRRTNTARAKARAKRKLRLE